MPWQSDWVAISGALWRPMAPAEISTLTGIPVARVVERLAAMEQKQAVRKYGNGHWERA